MWKRERQKMRGRQTISKEISLRMTDDYDVDKLGSPHLMHINQVLDIIREVELDHVGQSDQKFLSTKEKYRLALFFMKLIEDPSAFPYLEKRSGGENSESIRPDLKPY
jgi:hypothetical protein